MSRLKVGDMVRVLRETAVHVFEIGSVVQMAAYGSDGIHLFEDFTGARWFMDPEEYEYVCGKNIIQLNHQYTSKNGQKWECIAVRGDTAWLVAESGKGAAYTFKFDGTNICQDGGEWDIKWEPVVEWVDTKGSWAKAGCHPQRQYNYAIRFPLIDGEPDFTQASVTPTSDS